MVAQTIAGRSHRGHAPHVHPHARRRGFYLLGLAGLSLGLHLWLAQGVLFPIPRSTGVEYVFVSASGARFGALTAAACAFVFAGHLLVRLAGAAQGAQPPLFADEDVAYARPFLVFAACALALLNLVPGLGRVLPTWSYLVVDLRWWWRALVLGWVLVGIDGRLRGALRGWLARAQPPAGIRRWTPEVALAAIAIAWAVAGTPTLRFSGVTYGDEPKYLRYCELLYQGLGFEISAVRPIAELPADFRPRVWRSVGLLARTIPGELRSLAADVRTFIADPSHQFNRARKTRGFLRGKNGGVYQVHSPGLSFLMFPAYYLDRRFAPVEPGSPAQWPARLPAVNSFFLALYVVWSIVIFRFLRRTVETTTWVAWITTLAVVLTLPVAAFPFQFYPELAAGLLLFLVAGHLLSPGPRTPGAAFFYGLLAGYLPWLHVRFSALAGVLALGAVVLDARHDRHSRDSRSMRAFLAGFFLPLALFALYAYRLTGSVLPTAIWSEDEAGPVLSWAGLTHGSVAYLVDRDWGLFAHAPVYLLAIPGYWWMAQRRRDVAWLSGLAFLALLLPAAAHSLRAAVTTPTRLILAVLPLAAVPLAELLARRGRSRLLQVSFALLLVVSLHSALAYNRHHAKHVGPLVDWGFSGWEVNLLFPLDSRQAWQMSPANGMLWIAWIATLLILLCAPAFRQHVQARGWTLPQLPRPIRSIPGIAVALIIAFALLGTSIAAATGVWDKADYRMPAEPPAMEAAVLLDRMGHCAICVSSARGRLEAGSLLASLADVAPSIARRDVVVWDYDDWLLMPGRIRAWYIEANGREPSDEDVGHHLYQWREEHVAPAEIRRRILAAAGKQGPAGGR